jgi:hypothetical protein
VQLIYANKNEKRINKSGRVKKRIGIKMNIDNEGNTKFKDFPQDLLP